MYKYQKIIKIFSFAKNNFLKHEKYPYSEL